jgi:hypothetical protein
MRQSQASGCWPRRRGGCLQRIAQVIDGSKVDTNGLSARYGGEEFAIVTRCETIERQEGSLRNCTRERPSPRSRQEARIWMRWLQVRAAVTPSVCTTHSRISRHPRRGRLGAASETVSKFTSRWDPAAQWTGAYKGHASFAYADNYLIDLKEAIIVDVEATRAIRQLASKSG